MRKVWLGGLLCLGGVAAYLVGWITEPIFHLTMVVGIGLGVYFRHLEKGEE